jgi:hypothetical protein
MDESYNYAFAIITKEADKKKKEWEVRLEKVRADDFPFVQVYIATIS